MSLEDYLDNESSKGLGISWSIRISVRNGATYKDAFRHCHYICHSAEMKIENEDRDLDCEICSGLPPWEWTVTKAYVRAYKPESYGYQNNKLKYNIVYTAFAWRTPRIFKKTVFLFDKCRVCGSFRRCARHKAEGIMYQGSICLKCVREEEREAKKLDQAKEVQRLLKQLNRNHKPRRISNAKRS